MLFSSKIQPYFTSYAKFEIAMKLSLNSLGVIIFLTWMINRSTWQMQFLLFVLPHICFHIHESENEINRTESTVIQYKNLASDHT